jgi:hypothetical protein
MTESLSARAALDSPCFQKVLQQYLGGNLVDAILSLFLCQRCVCH